MERLTRVFEKDNQKYVCIDVCGEKCVENYTFCPKCKPLTSVMKKLAEYEDLEEQGLLLKLPCKVGDVLYCFDYPRSDIVVVVEEEVELINVQTDDAWIETSGGSYRCYDFDKIVFLTKAEAEKALEEMEK